MFAELVDGTADTDLALIVALILAFVWCVYRLVLRAFDGALAAAIVFFLILAWLVRA